MVYRRKKKVSFWAVKGVPKRVRVSFRNRYGERVSFTATKRVPTVTRVSFWASKSGKKIKRRKI